VHRGNARGCGHCIRSPASQSRTHILYRAGEVSHCCFDYIPDSSVWVQVEPEIDETVPGRRGNESSRSQSAVVGYEPTSSSEHCRGHCAVRPPPNMAFITYPPHWPFDKTLPLS
jgi:hypothetical protein